MNISRRAKNASQIGFSIANQVIRSLDLRSTENASKQPDKAQILQNVLSYVIQQIKASTSSDDIVRLNQLKTDVINLIKLERQSRQQSINLGALAKLDRSQPGDAYVHQMLTGLSRRSSISGPRIKSKRKPLITSYRALANVNMLTFDSFAFDQDTNHRPLSMLAFYLIRKEGLIEDLKLDADKVAHYFNLIEAGYNETPYHNRVHAADVLQRFYAIIKTVSDDVFSAEQKLTCIIAAAVHDYAHAGVTNAFLIKTKHILARRYNDISPWENHHVAAAWDILMTPEANFLENLNEDTTDQIRQDIISMVLATDMTKHLKWMKRCDDDASPLGLEDQPDKKSKALILALKAADVGHTCCDWPVHVRWVDALQKELYTQGDIEAQYGIPHTPMTDRSNSVDIRSSQISFFDVVILPMFSLLTIYFQGTMPMLLTVQKNRDATRFNRP